jgi:hypothetical protein
VLLLMCAVTIFLRIAFPQLNGFVVFKGGRCDDIFGWMAGGTQDGVGVSLQALDNFLGLKVPNVHHVVFTPRHDPLELKKENLC